VTVSAEGLLNETTSSVAVVTSQQRGSDLPLVGGHVLDLLSIWPGFRANPPFDSSSTVDGLSLDTVKATVNGVITTSSRDVPSLWGRQVLTTSIINPDLVGEIRWILSPVDAELG